MSRAQPVDASVACHFTPRDAARAPFLYYFLRGRGFIDRASVGYDGEEFKTPGHVYVHLDPKLSGNGHSNSADFSRQELPVPVVRLRVDIPIGNGYAARPSIGGGGLPRVTTCSRGTSR